MRPLLMLVAGGLLAAAVLGSASAQEAPLIGAPVKDAAGRPVGVIEKVVYVDGRARQVQIRQGPALRTLPVDGLSLQGGAYVTVLSKAEFEALPVSD